MSNVESNLHAALIGQAEVMVAALSYTAIWSQKGGDKPAGEHVTIQHLPNDNNQLGLSDQISERQGFLIITLVSPLDIYEVVSKEKAGAIAGYFLSGTRLTVNATKVAIMSHSVRQGREQGQRWETPIWISYRSIT